MSLKKLINTIKYNKQIKNYIINTKLNKNEEKLIKLFLKINLISFCKKEQKDNHIIKINEKNSLAITNRLRKKKIFLKKKSEKINIISNSNGFNILKKNQGGLLIMSLI